MQKLFKNANVVDLFSGDVVLCDLFVKGGKFVKISKTSPNSKISASSKQSCCKGGMIEASVSDEVIDLKGNFVLPPFVNVFCNSKTAFMKSYLNFDEEEQEANSEIATQNLVNIQMLMKIKNVLAGAICNDVSICADDKGCENVLKADNEEIVQNAKFSCVSNEFNSVSLENISEKTEQELANLTDFVAKNEANLFLRCGRTLEELGTIDLQYKKSLPHVLEDFGFLDRKAAIVGGNCFEKDDLELFSQYDCAFCVTPSDDGKSGIRPTNLMSLKAKDFLVGMGSGDSFEIDFFAFMRQIIMTQRELFEQVDVIDEKDTFQIATYAGAQILRIDDFGICEGNSANFIVVAKTPTLYSSALKTLVWEKSKKDVLMTIFDGEILQKNGEIFMKNVSSCDTIIMEIKQQIRRNKNDN